MNKVFINDKPLHLIESAVNIEPLHVIEWNGMDSILAAISRLLNEKETGYLYLLVKDQEKAEAFFVKHFLYIEAAGGLVQNTDDKYLFIFRHGKWDLPKGKAERGETIEETALREVEEECGIAPLEIIKPLPSSYHMYMLNGKWALKRSFWYLMAYEGDQPLVAQTEESITDVKWIAAEEIPVLMKNTYETIKLVVQEIV